MPISALYPHAAPPQQNSLLSNPLEAIYGLQSLQQFRSNQAVGRAFQGATDAQGNFNPGAAQSAIANDPAAALGAPEATTRILAARMQNTANATAQLGLAVGQNDAASSYLTSLYGKNLSPDDVNVARTRLAAMGVPVGILGGITSPDQLQNAVNAAIRMRAGAGTLISPTQGASTAAGQPTVQPLGQTVGQGARGIGISGTGQADLNAYTTDLAASGATIAQLRPLERALPLIANLNHADFGPTSNGWAPLVGAVSTITGVDPNSMTSNLGLRQELAKYLAQATRGLPGSQRSDEAQALAQSASPNLDQTKTAVDALTRSIIGMARQDATVAAAAAAPNDYNNFKRSFYLNTDSRAFEPMTKADLKAYYDSVKNDPAALQRARDSIRAARQWGGATAPMQ